jgi:hypothetical protein
MMKFLPPDLENAMELSASDPNQAAEVLRIAAKYLRGQERMPDALAHYLADAFERAMKRASVVRGSELLMNLNLKVTHRRTTANFEYVGFDLDRLLQSKVPKGEAILRVGEKYRISVATVKRMYGTYQAFKASEAEADSLLYQELQSDSTVPSVTSKKPKK